MLISTEEFSCGECGAINTVRGRSRKEHNILFGYISLCCDNWPEQYPYQPQHGDPEHLRAWALIRIGHCREIGLPGYDPKLKGFLRIVAGFVGCRYFETNVRDGQIYILAPRTTKAKKGGITRKEYNRVTRSIEDLLYPITGINIEVYKERKRNQSPAEETAFVTQ